MNRIYNFLFLSCSIAIVLTLTYGFIPSNILPTALIEVNKSVEESFLINEHASISIFGEVNQPGVYSIQNGNLTLSQLVNKAGDFTIKADTEAIVILRRNNGNRMITYANAQGSIIPNQENLILQDSDVVYIEPLNLASTPVHNYKHLLPFASAFICVAAFLISAFKG